MGNFFVHLIRWQKENIEDSRRPIFKRTISNFTERQFKRWKKDNTYDDRRAIWNIADMIEAQCHYQRLHMNSIKYDRIITWQTLIKLTRGHICDRGTISKMIELQYKRWQMD